MEKIVRIDASQLRLFSMCQAIPAGLYRRWELDSESGKFESHQIKTRPFENMLMLRRVHREKLMDTMLMAFVDTAALCLKQWVANINIAHVNKVVLLSLRKQISEVLDRATRITKTIHTRTGL